MKVLALIGFALLHSTEGLDIYSFPQYITEAVRSPDVLELDTQTNELRPLTNNKECIDQCMIAAGCRLPSNTPGKLCNDGSRNPGTETNLHTSTLVKEGHRSTISYVRIYYSKIVGYCCAPDILENYKRGRGKRMVDPKSQYHYCVNECSFNATNIKITNLEAKMEEIGESSKQDLTTITSSIALTNIEVSNVKTHLENINDQLLPAQEEVMNKMQTSLTEIQNWQTLQTANTNEMKSSFVELKTLIQQTIDENSRLRALLENSGNPDGGTGTAPSPVTNDPKSPPTSENNSIVIPIVSAICGTLFFVASGLFIYSKRKDAKQTMSVVSEVPPYIQKS